MANLMDCMGIAKSLLEMRLWGISSSDFFSVLKIVYSAILYLIK
jgi:hypothetical protein